MKIEVGESLALSYLKHIEGCRIVQMNWKTSRRWQISPEHKKETEKLFKQLKKAKNFSRIFGKNNFDQLLKQTEIDVLGLDVVNNSVWGIEIAVHSKGSGLNYGKSKEKTTQKVVKKLLRMIFIMKCYFNDFGKYNAFFITPKMQPDMKSSINSLIEEMKTVIDDEAINIEVIGDDEFFSRIMQPIIAEDFDEPDTSEIFSRASTLLKMNYSIVPKGKVDEKKNALKLESTAIMPHTESNMKIGQFVQVKMRELEEKGLLTATEISNLLMPNYSKDVFDQNFCVLRKVEEGRKDDLGRDRYYANTYFEKYYLTSQWYERHWDFFKKWLQKFEK